MTAKPNRKDWIRYFGAPIAYDAAGVTLLADRAVRVTSGERGNRTQQNMTVGEMVAASLTFTPPVRYRPI